MERTVRHERVSRICLRAFWWSIHAVALLSGPSLSADTPMPGVALVENPGFEVGNGNVPDSWILYTGAAGNRFDWVGDDVHSGSKSCRMSANDPAAPGRSMALESNSFKVSAHSRVEASMWIKARDVVSHGDVGWYRLRVTLTAYDGFGAKIEHRDLMNTQGSFDWMQIRGGMTVPAGADTMDLSVKLTTSTGTVWVDDAEVTLVMELPNVDPNEIRYPVLIPHPWKVGLGGGTFELQDVAIINESSDARIGEVADVLLTQKGVVHEFIDGNDPRAGSFSTLLLLGDRTNPRLNAELASRFPDHDWLGLGEQGYFLSAGKKEGQGFICVGANSDVGRFYAIQTLKQLAVGNHVYIADILDRPSVWRRGITMGYHWFQERNEEGLKRLTELKFNFVWAQGSFLDNCLDTDNWRLDFTSTQKAILEEFIDLYQKNYIELWMCIAPRGKNPPLQYSSDEDIDTVVGKLDALYNLGLRNFGLRFDDLANIGEDELLVEQDIEAFSGDIGAAQVYFITEVYTRFIEGHSDASLVIIPMDYNRIGNISPDDPGALRLLQVRRLPADIGLHCHAPYDEDVMAMTSLTEHSSVIVCSHFYSAAEIPREFVLPYMSFLSWSDSSIRARIAGVTWLPAIPRNEDTALISWHTTADFAWCPERYDPNASFGRAAARYLSTADK